MECTTDPNPSQSHPLCKEYWSQFSNGTLETVRIIKDDEKIDVTCWNEMSLEQPYFGWCGVCTTDEPNKPGYCTLNERTTHAKKVHDLIV